MYGPMLTIMKKIANIQTSKFHNSLNNFGGETIGVGMIFKSESDMCRVFSEEMPFYILYSFIVLC